MPEGTFVLLIEDEPELRELAETVLESAGMLVVSASDGARALRLLERMSPDVIVTDMMMPVLDGFGFLESYRKRSAPKAPVLAVSAFDPYLRKAEAAGATAVLAKPYTAGTLIEAVRRLVAGTRATVHAPPSPRPEDSEASALVPPRSDADREAARLRAVFDLNLQGPAPERRLHDFVVEVAAHFEAPISLVSVVDKELHYWTAASGMPEGEVGKEHGVPRSEVFCTHAVAARAALVVQDSAKNPFFRDNPAVTKRGFRFYAGVPLVAACGDAVGTLCLLDMRARTFTHYDLELLSLFANRVICALEWRTRRESPEMPDTSFRFLQFYDEVLGAFGRKAFHDLAIVEAARAAEKRRRLVCVALDVPFERLGAVVDALTAARPRTLVGRLGHARLGWLVSGVSAREARQIALDVAGANANANAAQLERYAGGIPTVLDALEASLPGHAHASRRERTSSR